MTETYTLTFTKEYEVNCDIDQAVRDFYDTLRWNPHTDPDNALYGALEENLLYDYDLGDIPQTIIEKFADIMRLRIGGVQLEMELDE